MIEAISWENGMVKVLDQRLLPLQVKYLFCSTVPEVAKAIKEMATRGAPLIGIAAGYGIALAAWNNRHRSSDGVFSAMEEAFRVLEDTRPTARNLFWALERMLEKGKTLKEEEVPSEAMVQEILHEALAIAGEDREACQSMGRHGAPFLPDRGGVLTHCNTGSLATGGIGTALGVIRTAFQEGKKLHVYVCEARPALQGSRLTAWELLQDKIPFTLITDGMAGFFMAKGEIQAAVVGADRVAANGDVANKIGTYSLAILAKAHRVPFYVACPLSTIDLSTPGGEKIPIEERSKEEVTHIQRLPVAPEGVSVSNPAFDVTPSSYVAAIITERGVLSPPYEKSISAALAEAPSRTFPPQSGVMRSP